MTDQRIVDVVQIIAGKATVAEVADRHHVTAAEVELWRQTYLAGLEGAAAGGRSLGRRRWPAALLACLVVAGLSSRVSFASGSACGETLPGTMKPFCPDSPALSAEVNQIFRDLITLIETKFGALNSPDVAIAGGVALSRASFASTAFDGGTSTPVIVNDTVSQALVLVGRGTAPNRAVTVRDDLFVVSDLSVAGHTTVSGNLTVSGSLAGGNVAGTIAGGGLLNCILGSASPLVINCTETFGGAGCGTGTPCSTSTRITCPGGSTPRDYSRNCTSAGVGVPYACITGSLCVRD